MKIISALGETGGASARALPKAAGNRSGIIPVCAAPFEAFFAAKTNSREIARISAPVIGLGFTLQPRHAAHSESAVRNLKTRVTILERR